jgi:hypothetical protein
VADDDPAVDVELAEIAGWVAAVEDPALVRATIVNRLEHVVWRLRQADADEGAGDQLLVVALRTDGHDLQRRLGQVLAVAQPQVVRGQPLAWAKPVAELTEADALLLAGMFGETASVLGVGVELLLPSHVVGENGELL